VVVKLPEDSDELDGVVSRGDGVLAFVTRHEGHVLVVVGDRLGGRDLKTIIMHEVGHLLGAAHVNMKGSLMYPAYGWNQVSCIDKVTVAQVAGYLELDMKQMNYCMTPGWE
jgi:hypothetical protein